MFKVILVANKDDDYFFVSVILHLLEPLADRFERLPLCDVVNEEHSDGLSVVGVSDRPVPLLASCIPDLSPDHHVSNRDIVRGELNTNRRRSLLLKLIARISEQ